MTIPASSLAALLASPQPGSASWKWQFVKERFSRFHTNLLLTPAQRKDGLIKANGVLGSLSRHYYGEAEGDLPHGFFIGSWGKNTATRPPRDVDVYFVLPLETYYRFQAYTRNRQSALLQELKNVLGQTYPSTDMSGDGQIILVGFDSYNVEVVPAFSLEGGGYWICDTTNGGSYKKVDPFAEIAHIDASDKANFLNVRQLSRMLKAWQAWCNVPLKSFQLDLLVAGFLSQSPWRQNDFFYYDWLLRDFFFYLHRQANGFVIMPGTFEVIALGDAWATRAWSAYERAVKACDYERDDYQVLAGEEWQKIFGPDIPAYF